MHITKLVDKGILIKIVITLKSLFETAGEEARWQLHKNVANNIE